MSASPNRPPHDTQPVAHWETITPLMAAAMIAATASRNRPLSQPHVRHLAGQMKGGHWCENGESLIIDDRSNVIDGNHRLRACVTAGVPFRTLVVRGVKAEAFSTIDTAKPRRAGDYLYVAGEGNTTQLAALLRLVWLWEHGRLHLGNRNGTSGNRAQTSLKGWVSIGKLTPDDYRDVLARHPGCREAVGKGSTLFDRFRGLSKTNWALLYHALGTFDPALRDQWCERVSTGAGLGPTHPCLAYRNRMVRNQGEKAKLPQPDVLALAIKSWRAFCLNQPVRRLQWQSMGDKPEKFPAVNPHADDDFPDGPPGRKAADEVFAEHLNESESQDPDAPDAPDGVTVA